MHNNQFYYYFAAKNFGKCPFSKNWFWNTLTLMCFYDYEGCFNFNGKKERKRKYFKQCRKMLQNCVFKAKNKNNNQICLQNKMYYFPWEISAS